MKTDSRTKAIHYKRVQLTHCKSTLQELLEDAFKAEGSAVKAKSRLESISQDDEVFRLVNHYAKKEQNVFGQLIVFEKGKSQAFLTIDDNSEYYSIDSLDASNIIEEGEPDDRPEDVGKDKSNAESKINRRKEFIDSMLYFGVKNNHLVLIQSTALKARDLEAHLKWLFDGHAENFSSSTALIFQDKPSPGIVKKLEGSPAKSIFIGAPIETGEGKLVDEASQVSSGEKGIVTNTTNKIKFVPKGLGADLVKSLMDQDWFNNQDLSEALDEANLKVSLEITYLRKTTKQGHKLLDNMATALRHQHEDDVKILLDGGGEITGKELKLSGKLSVKFFNGIIDETDLFEKMTVWLKEKISSEEVDNDSVAKPKDSGDAEA